MTAHDGPGSVVGDARKRAAESTKNTDRDALIWIISGEGVWEDRVPHVADAILAAGWTRAALSSPESPVSTRSEGVTDAIAAALDAVNSPPHYLSDEAQRVYLVAMHDAAQIARAVGYPHAALSAPVPDVAATLRRLAKDAYERGDIGKDGGVEAWDYLNAHADKIEADGVPDVAAERVAAIKAEALREAADEVPWDQYVEARRDVSGWLRDRAAALTSEQSAALAGTDEAGQS